MPVSPDDGARLAARVVELVADAELVMLRRVSSSLRAGVDAPGWVTAKLTELQTLRRRLTGDLAALDRDLAATVDALVAEAYTLGQAGAVGDLDDVNLPPGLPAGQFAAVRTIAADTLTAVRGVPPVALRAVTDAYQAVVAEASTTVLVGAQTRVQAAQQALDRLLGNGITGFTDTAGRQWAMESYVEMAVRTGTGRAAVQGHVDTLAASGQDLVYVIPGPRACPICDAWAGQVLSITGGTTGTVTAAGRTRVAGSLEDARAAGWGHPNCRCATGIYLPGVTEPSVDRSTPAAYEAQQEQRRLERGIRTWKRRQALALSPEAERAAAAKVQAWQGRLRGHLAAHPELKRQRRREQVGRAV